MISYTVTDITLNEISRFYELLGRIYLALEILDKELISDLLEQNQFISSYAAVSITKTPLGKAKDTISFPKLQKVLAQKSALDQKKLDKHNKFLKNFKKELDYKQELDLAYVEKLYTKLFSLSDEIEYRTSNLIKTVNIVEQDFHKTLKYRPEVSHERIKYELKQFFEWYQEHKDRVNPTILSAITHFEIARIHPFKDGNGRLAKMLGRSTLYSNSIDSDLILPLETFYLENIEHYFDIFAKAVEKKDLTNWLEFYTRGLKNAAADVCERLYALSGGTVDLNKLKIENLTHNELKVVRIIAKERTFNGSEIARMMGVSRQYINNTVKVLVEKGILVNISESETRPKYVLGYLV